MCYRTSGKVCLVLHRPRKRVCWKKKKEKFLDIIHFTASPVSSIISLINKKSYFLEWFRITITLFMMLPIYLKLNDFYFKFDEWIIVSCISCIRSYVTQTNWMNSYLLQIVHNNVIVYVVVIILYKYINLQLLGILKG